MTKDEILSLFKLYPLPFDLIGYKMDLTVETINNWLRGRSVPPPYLEFILAAIWHDKTPLTDKELETRDLTPLGVQPGTVAGWRRNGYPRAVRLAATMVPMTYTSFKPQPQTLINIHTAKYYRRRGSKTWFARPVLGKPYPDIRGETMERLIDARLVYIPDWRPRLTAKGLEYAYRKDR